MKKKQPLSFQIERTITVRRKITIFPLSFKEDTLFDYIFIDRITKNLYSKVHFLKKIFHTQT